MRRFALVVATGLAVMAAACTGDTPKSDGGQKCLGINYDPCNTEHDCANGNCLPFADKGYMICTLACTPGDNTTCPPQYVTTPVTCNAAGLCEPDAPNSCKIQ